MPAQHNTSWTTTAAQLNALADSYAKLAIRAAEPNHWPLQNLIRDIVIASSQGRIIKDPSAALEAIYYEKVTSRFYA